MPIRFCAYMAQNRLSLGHIIYDDEADINKIYPPEIVEKFIQKYDKILVVGSGFTQTGQFPHIAPTELTKLRTKNTKILLSDLVELGTLKYQNNDIGKHLKDGNITLLILPENIGGSNFWTSITHQSFCGADTVGMVNQVIIPNLTVPGSGTTNFNVVNGRYAFSRTQNITLQKITVPSGPINMAQKITVPSGPINMAQQHKQTTERDNVSKSLAFAHYTFPHLISNGDDDSQKPALETLEIFRDETKADFFTSSRPFCEPGTTGHHQIKIAIPFNAKTDDIRQKRATIREELRKAGGLMFGGPIDDPGLGGYYSCTTMVSTADRARKLAKKLVQADNEIMAIYAEDFFASTQNNPQCVNFRLGGKDKDKDTFLCSKALECTAFYPVSTYTFRTVGTGTIQQKIEKMRSFNSFHKSTRSRNTKGDIFIAIETNEKNFYVNQQRKGRTQAVQNRILANRPSALLFGPRPTMSTEDITELAAARSKLISLTRTISNGASTQQGTSP